MKKAQGLSMNVIIIAAISLLVLVIISVLVLRAGGNVNRNTGCEGVGGRCVLKTTGCAPGEQRDVAHGCPDSTTQMCCINLNS